MNKLWIFGDSFSSLIDFENLQNENVKNYLIINNITNFETWSQILSKKLNFSLENFARGGKSNYQIFFDFCDNIENIGENDTVIIGWALLGKFIIADNQKFVDIHPYGDYFHYDIKNESLQEIISNRKNETWIKEINHWKKLINFTSLSKKFRLIYWSGEEKLLKNNHIIVSKCQTILDETNGIIHDSHLGMNGHKLLAEMFYNIIING